MLQSVRNKRESFYTIGGKVDWCSHYGEQYEVPSKTKNRTTIWSNNPTSGHIPGENHNSKRYMHPNVHRITIYNSQGMETS